MLGRGAWVGKSELPYPMDTAAKIAREEKSLSWEELKSFVTQTREMRDQYQRLLAENNALKRDLRVAEYTVSLLQVDENGKDAEIRVALENELALIESTIDTYETPKKAIGALIDWHVQTAIDPVFK